MEKEKYIPGYIQRREQLYKSANMLMVATLVFHTLRGLISLSLGFIESSIALLAFGFDSFAELAYWAAAWSMLQRSGEDSFVDINNFEQKTLRISGKIFYALSIGIAVTALISLISGHKPYSAFSGIAISIISAGSLFGLFFYKSRVGEKLKSDVITDDAEHTKLSLYLSIILLISSLSCALTGAGFLDSAGALVLGVFIFIKGNAVLQKAKDSGTVGC